MTLTLSRAEARRFLANYHSERARKPPSFKRGMNCPTLWGVIGWDTTQGNRSYIFKRLVARVCIAEFRELTCCETACRASSKN